MTTTAPSSTAQEPREHLAIIPYSIIESLSQLDNIYEARLFGWVIAKAQSVLKLYNKDLSDINVQFALNVVRVTIPVRYLLSPSDDNYNQAKRAFTLADKKIEYQKDNHYYRLSIIALPEYIKDGRSSFITFIIHNQLWHALLDFSKGYRLFALSSLMSLQSTYSVILFLLVTQQQNPIHLTMDYLRKLLGIDGKKGYDRSNNIFQKILDPARQELERKCPMTFEYSARRTGSNGRYTEIFLTPRLSDKSKAQPAPNKAEIVKAVEVFRVRMSDNIKWYLQANYEFDATGLATVERLLPAKWSEQETIDFLERIRHTCLTNRIRNKRGYLVNSLKNV